MNCILVKLVDIVASYTINLVVVKCLNANKKIVNKSLLVVIAIFTQLETFCYVISQAIKS